MEMSKRFKTKYPGVFYRTVNRRGKPGKQQKSFFIIFKVRGKLHEEKAGLQYDDGMTAAKGSRIRAQRIEKKRPSPKERRERARWTFNALWDEYVRQRVEVNHADLSRFRTYVEPTIGSRRPDEIKPRHIDKIRMENLAGKSDGTTYAVLALIGRIASFGADKALCAGLSFKIKKPRVDNEVTECLTQDELTRFMAVLDANPGDVSASLKMALFTAMRRKEIFKLEWRDIDEERGFIRLRDPKGGKDQTIPLNAAARTVIEGQPRDRELVFGYKDPQRAYEHARKLKKKAKLPEAFRIYHGCRHTHASYLASSGKVDLYVLQRLLTHKNPKQTARYAHLRDEALRAGSDVAADIFGGANGKG
jgi:integrase